MKRLIDFLGSGVGILLPFALGVLLFSWPLMSITADEGGVPFFCYLFIAWAGLIVVLFLISRAADRDGPGGREK